MGRDPATERLATASGAPASRLELRRFHRLWDQALESVEATKATMPRQDLFLSPFNTALETLPAMHHARFVLKLPKGVLIG